MAGSNDVESIREEEKAIKRKLDLDFVRIAAPALVQFTAEPLASSVDTIYLGRLGERPNPTMERRRRHYCN